MFSKMPSTVDEICPSSSGVSCNGSNSDAASSDCISTRSGIRRQSSGKSEDSGKVRKRENLEPLFVSCDSEGQRYFKTCGFDGLEEIPPVVEASQSVCRLFKAFWTEVALSKASDEQFVAEHYLNYYGYDPASNTWYRCPSLACVLLEQDASSNTSYLKTVRSSRNKLLDSLTTFEASFKEESEDEDISMASDISLPMSSFHQASSGDENPYYDTTKFLQVPSDYLKYCPTCSVAADTISHVQTNYAAYINALPYTPLLHRSKAADFLPTYYPDGIGNFPSGSLLERKRRKLTSSTSVPSYIQPFYSGSDDCSRALTIRPDIMEIAEARAFPEFYKNQIPYISLRNLAISVWYSNPKQALLSQDLLQHIFVPGLARVAYSALASRVIQYLTKIGLINYGVLSIPRGESLQPELSSDAKRKKIVIVGAGPAGITVASQLTRFGFKNVHILEARGRIGGRVSDICVRDDVDGTFSVQTGAMIVNGYVNNPFCLMYRQLGIGQFKLGNRCKLFDSESGREISAEPDEKIQNIFNSALDEINKFRNMKKMFGRCSGRNRPEASLQSLINMFTHEKLSKASELEKRIFEFHRANLEYSCGANLGQVSAFQWDQNENFPQFAGDHVWLHKGFGTCLEELAKGQAISFGKVVTRIDYSSPTTTSEKTQQAGKTGTTIHLATGETIPSIDYVVCTVPISLLQSRAITFNPVLPKHKVDSMARVGAGLIEKIIMKFDKRFWQEKIQKADFFGMINTAKTRGMCSVFYDVTPRDMHNGGVILGISSGDFVNEVYPHTSDADLVDQAMEMLRRVFGRSSMGRLVWSKVTRWGDDVFARMSYSYMKVGSEGADYDRIAEPVDNRVLFAGEATNRHFPQTATGAYLSGLREATRIVQYES